MSHSRHPSSHDENRRKVCVVCFQKAINPISDVVLQRIRSFFIEDYDLDESCCPAAICSKCRSDLLDISNGKKSTDILPDVFDFGLIYPNVVAPTRSKPHRICLCQICETARTPGILAPKRKKGRPSISTTDQFAKSKLTIMKLCSSCKSPVGKGLSHECNLSSLRKNLVSLCDDSDKRTKNIVAGDILRAQVQDNGGKKDITLATRGPNPLPVHVGSRNDSPPVFSSSQMSALQLSLGCSNKKMVHQMIPFIRSVLGRKSVEVRTDVSIRSRDKRFDDFFNFTFIEFEGTENQLPVVYCNDLEGFIQSICDSRQLENDALKVKMGLDKGGGFFKITLSIFTDDVLLNPDHPSESPDRHTTLRNTGVKKIMLIAIAPEVKETYTNVKIILDLLQIAHLSFQFTHAVDLKMGNIITGIQAHGSTHPCLWCECPKADFDKPESGSYVIRNLGSVRKQAREFRDAKATSERVSAKDFKNCVHDPLMTGDDHDIFIRCIPPPELHLLLRVTNKLYKEMEKSCRQADQILEMWLKKIGISRPKLHSGEFNGNSCRHLLLCVDTLEAIVIDQGEFSLMKFCAALRRFNDVREACFGNVLAPDFGQKIANFKKAYLDLSVTVPTSVHVVFDHVVQFCKFRRTSLGSFSEQASEAAHSDFSSLWENSGKTSLSKDSYGERLLTTTVRYNSRHL